MGTGSFPGESGRGVALTTHPPSSAKVKEREELYLYSPCGSTWPVLGELLHFTAVLLQDTYTLFNPVHVLLRVSWWHGSSRPRHHGIAGNYKALTATITRQWTQNNLPSHTPQSASATWRAVRVHIATKADRSAKLWAGDNRHVLVGRTLRQGYTGYIWGVIWRLHNATYTWAA